MGSESVKVVVRCRPLNDREKALSCKMVLSMDLQRCQCFIEKPGAVDEPPKQFTFDGTYYIDQTTEQMYNEILILILWLSGKSFTMQGVSEPATQKGVIPRAFEHIFESIQCAENTKFLVRASYLEIYNEEIRDLLGSDAKQRLELKEHPERGVYVRDLSMHTVHSVGECERIIEKGWRNRAVGYTLMNKDSSRSHSIFTIHLEICSTDSSGQDHLRAGKLNLVDLAGSERQSKTGATGERLREATKINLSLSALGNVISALVDGRSRYIPYRDSKLTRLLQDSLGGNTRTLMIACLSPADNNYEESLSTLRYANRAKSIQNRPRINEDPKDALLREYQEEIKKLRALLTGQLSTADLSRRKRLKRQTWTNPTQQFITSTLSMHCIKTLLAKLQAEYNAEQESKAKLQEDIAALRSSYESKLSSLEKAQVSRGSSVPKNELCMSTDPMCHSTVEETSQTKVVSSPTFHKDHSSSNHIRILKQGNKAILCRQNVEFYSLVLASKLSEKDPDRAGLLESSDATAPGPLDQKHVLERFVGLHYNNIARIILSTHLCGVLGVQSFLRLQQLEQEVVGGEQARNKELQQRQRQRKKLADQRKAQLVHALSENSEESENVLLNVYNSIQEEVHAKNQMLVKVQGKLKAAKLEIRDLQAEFEVERNDYLVTIRRLEKEGQLLHSLLERMVPLVRRDCNYSNLDRLKKDAVWDEDSATWRLPDVMVQKTTLPSAVTPKASARRGSGSDAGEAFMEDRYKQMLDRSDSENIASSYFKSKRASQLLGSDTAKAHVNVAGHLSVSGSNMNLSASSDAILPRPFRLESLDVPVSNGKVKRKKSKSHIHNEAT
uniref:Kinesin-like protein n=1 Tax=Neolamprologus brichardi TaxID=32507 RepID=A0A3Q4GTM0_NEOBR